MNRRQHAAPYRIAAGLLAVVGGLAFSTARAQTTGPHPELALQIGHSGKVRHTAVAPDGGALVTLGTDDTIRIWDPRTRDLRYTLTGRWKELSSVAFSDNSA